MPLNITLEVYSEKSILNVFSLTIKNAFLCLFYRGVTGYFSILLGICDSKNVGKHLILTEFI